MALGPFAWPVFSFSRKRPLYSQCLSPLHEALAVSDAPSLNSELIFVMASVLSHGPNIFQNSEIPGVEKCGPLNNKSLQGKKKVLSSYKISVTSITLNPPWLCSSLLKTLSHSAS